MAEIFSALPCDARIQQVCDLITRSIEHGHQFRRTVLQRKCEPPFVATPPPVRQSSAARKVAHAPARVLQKALSRPRCFACCDSASQGALRSAASGTLRLPVKDPPPPQPLPDQPSLEVLRLRGRSGRGPSRARPTLLRIHSATAVSMSRREARSLHSSPNPCSKHGERRHDSTVGSVTAAEARTSLTGGAFIGKPRVINMRIGSARPAASEHASMQQRRPPRPAQDRYAAQSTPRLRGP